MPAHVSRPSSLLGGVLLAALAGWTGAGEPAAPFGPESLFGWQFVGDPRISPDGKRIAYVRATVVRDRDEYDYDLWIDDGSGPRALTGGVADDRAPRWSPDGTSLAFTSNRSGKRQIYLLDMTSGGEPLQLTADTDGVQSFKWSNDGKRIAFTSQTALAGDPGFEDAVALTADAAIKARAPFVTERMRYRNDGSPGYRSVKRTHIWIVETEQGAKRAARRITTGDFDDGDPSWSPDGRMIYFSAQRTPDEDYANDTEVFVVPSDGSAEPRALTQRAGPNDDPLPSPDGRWIAFTGYDETTPPQSSYVTRLYVMRPDGSQVRQLAVDLDRSVPDSMTGDFSVPRVNGNRIAWSPDGSSILFTSCDRGQTHLYQVKVSSGAFAPLTRFRQGDLREFTVSRDGRVAAAFNSSARPAEIYAFPLAAAGRDDWQQISKHTAALAPAGGFSPYEEIWYDSFDGQRIQGWIAKPPAFTADRKYPFILYIHGGPHAMYGSGFFHEFQTLAQAGYVVLITNPRGSTGYGEKFANIIQYKYPGDDFRDLMAGVDEMLKRGYVDEKRMGVAGGSGGGLLTSWTVGQTDRFAAAVVERAVTNWHSFVGSSDLNYFFAKHWFRDFPWRDSADYLERSPLSHVDEVKTPVLVIHSEQDYRTAIDQGLQYYAALKMLKKPAKIAVFPESSHGLSRDGRPSQRVERLKIISAWFDENLKK